MTNPPEEKSGEMRRKKKSLEMRKYRRGWVRLGLRKWVGLGRIDGEREK